MNRPTILIAGAGIAGTTLAWWLRERGFDAVLIERAPALRRGGYMIDFWGLGMDVAERMGLRERLQEVGYHIDRMLFVDEDDQVRSELNNDIFTSILGDRFISLPRGELAAAIFQLVEGNTEVIFDETICALKELPDGIEVSFTNGKSRKFHLVIGCDGLHSGLRGQLFGPEKSFEKYLGYGSASFLTTGYPRQEEHTYFSYAAPGRQISRYTLRGDRTAFFFVWAQKE